jgi:hypothetical protein
MTEDFLHFVWKYKNFVPRNLKTVDGQSIKVIKSGEHNTNAGPDFTNAQVLVNNTHWAGNVEIHIKTSDWISHNHSSDPAYDNVILHAVYEHDMPTPIPEGRPLLELSPYIPPHVIENYNTLRGLHHLVPCESMIGEVNELTKAGWLDRMLVERLEAKANSIKQFLDINKNDWAETAYQWTARNFGFKINSEPFETLARAIPHKILGKHKNKLQQIESLLFGQAGFLQEVYKDDYPIALRKEYKYLAGKYNFSPGRKSEWKFLRLRPANFPTVRISQFAALVFKSEHLFSRILEVSDLKSALSLFNVSAAEYWKSHFMFDTVSESNYKGSLGKESKFNLIVNTVCPLLFSYGHIKNESKYKETALRLLEQCPPESNKITRESTKLGLPNLHAHNSQALIHLRKEFCTKQQCLNCGIGASVLNR